MIGREKTGKGKGYILPVHRLFVRRPSLEAILKYYAMKEDIVHYIGKVNKETTAIVRTVK